MKVEEYELSDLGYTLIKEDVIRCGNCKTQLLQLVKVLDNKNINYIIVQCPFCGDKSFKYVIEGKIYISAADRTFLSDIDTTIHDNKTIHNIKVGKL